MAWMTARPMNRLINCLSCASLVETVARKTATGTRRTSRADSVASGISDRARYLGVLPTALDAAA